MTPFLLKQKERMGAEADIYRQRRKLREFSPGGLNEYSLS